MKYLSMLSLVFLCACTYSPSALKDSKIPDYEHVSAGNWKSAANCMYRWLDNNNLVAFKNLDDDVSTANVVIYNSNNQAVYVFEFKQQKSLVRKRMYLAPDLLFPFLKENMNDAMRSCN